ncbi:MAG: CHASE domain-containing protein [Candidatus Saccharibacteria bacterium]|nr:CHASE domain-containing protein [Candidatus Saccharibacteria bacterium]
MFYINRQLLRRREVFLLRVLPTLIVFSAFTALTMLSWVTAKNNLVQEQQRLLDQNNMNAAAYIRQQLGTYQDVMRGAVGLFNASDSVTREEWNTYFQVYDITKNYPGLQSVGYLQVLPKANHTQYEVMMAQQGYQGFKIHPKSESAVSAVVSYIEPHNPNSTVVGYDMYTDPTRRQALEEARDTGQLVLTDLITLVNDVSRENRQPGFLMYIPIYKNGIVHNTIAERQADITGYVYAPFRTYDLINKILLEKNPSYALIIENVTPQGREKVYESENLATIKSAASSISSHAVIELPSASWEITGFASTGIVSRPFRIRPPSVLWGGLVFSIMVAAFIYMLLTSRAHALSEKEERNIQEAKDELLALASHQLRTPATGVKQYVGMLREGFAGTLTPLQHTLLDKAYDSNERQLSTINEMLFVARADAGHLKMTQERLDINALVKDKVEEQKNALKTRKQKLEVKIPKKPLFIIASRQYIGMVIENIISNATKYTHNKGTITVSVRRQKEHVVIRVKDTGVGIAAKDFNLLFKKFSRIPNELTDEVVGSGIGLYLSKKLVEAHGGQLHFESVEAKGSTVSVYLTHVD